MAYADLIFKAMCSDILEEGTDTQGQKVRPRWDDGTPAYTIKQFGVCHTYDLSKEFPVSTLRPLNLKNCIDEILWIWQKKSNNVHDLNSHIWDSWADENGEIGKAYGWQVGNVFQPVKQDGIVLELDQTDYMLHELKNNPYSRRILGNLYNIPDLPEMKLQPCCYGITLNVTFPVGSEKPVLNMVLNQRSLDILTAWNWNVCQYAILLHMFAQVSGMLPGKLVHMIADAHIYDKHVSIVQEMINREEHPAPKLWINPEVKNFYDFTVDDFKLIDYVAGPQYKIPVAV